MKQLFFAILSTGLMGIAQAQLKPSTAPIIQKTKNNTTGSQQTTAPTSALSDADYFLAVAKLTVKTAGDNKEKPSKLILRVYPAA